MPTFRSSGSGKVAGRPLRLAAALFVLCALFASVYQSKLYSGASISSWSSPSTGGGSSVTWAVSEALGSDEPGEPEGPADGEAEAEPLPAELLPAPAIPEAELVQRCGGTLGDWCRGYLLQPPIPARAPPRGTKDCLWDCNHGVGSCDRLIGICRCPAGWTDDSCSTPLKRPCSQTHRIHGFTPYDRPNNYTVGASGANIRCSGTCDDDTGQCFCPATMGNQTLKYGRIPAPLDAFPGTPPVKSGRPMGLHCQPDKDPLTGEASDFGPIDPELLFGPKGWCAAKKPSYDCICSHEGFCGPTCDDVCESFCPNQCSGHGECLSGWCQCHEGFWGHDCAYRLEGVEWTPGLETERPWIQDVVHTPAARDPKPEDTRKRPLIYVYELPPIFNSNILQYRQTRDTCVHRYFNAGNTSVLFDAEGYCSETGLHEALLQSEHRTLDPEEADFFYLPVYTSCQVFPVFAYGDFPYFHSHISVSRVWSGVNMLIEMHNWVRSRFPYWDRSGGRDHIVLQSFDEGSCWLPAVLRNVTMLTHWGRMDEHHISFTNFGPDNYTGVSGHTLYMPETSKDKLGDFPCYNPEKDLVIPAMSSYAKYPNSPLVGAPTKDRTILGFFKGRTLQDYPVYSRGIRQKLENLTRDNDWWGKHKVYLGQGMPPGTSFSYSDALSSALFCFALPGDGWSARLEDAVLHGCIPVIIQDNTHMPFESVLDYSSFTLRIPEKDMERVPQILEAVPKERVAELQQGVARVWRRFSYTGHRAYLKHAKDLRQQYAGRSKDDFKGPEALVPPQDYDFTQQDALETIYSWLHSRIPHTRPSGGGKGAGRGAGRRGGARRSGSGKRQGGDAGPS